MCDSCNFATQCVLYILLDGGVALIKNTDNAIIQSNVGDNLICHTYQTTWQGRLEADLELLYASFDMSRGIGHVFCIWMMHEVTGLHAMVSGNPSDIGVAGVGIAHSVGDREDYPNQLR